MSIWRRCMLTASWDASWRVDSGIIIRILQFIMAHRLLHINSEILHLVLTESTGSSKGHGPFFILTSVRRPRPANSSSRYQLKIFPPAEWRLPNVVTRNIVSLERHGTRGLLPKNTIGKRCHPARCKSRYWLSQSMVLGMGRTVVHHHRI
jgi:hypothetical protein